MRSDAGVSAARFFSGNSETKRLGHGGQILQMARDDFAVGRSRTLLEFVRRSLRDDRAVIDHDDAVTERVGLLEVLGRQQCGDAGLLEVGHQVPDTLPAAWIQSGRGFIQERHFGTDHQSTGDIDPPAHPAGIRTDTTGLPREPGRNGREVPSPAIAHRDFFSPCRRPNITRFSRPVSMSSRATC